MDRFQKAHSSYESLDQFNNALETLRVTDDYHLQKQLMLDAHHPNMQHNLIITSNDHQLKPVQPQKNYMLNTQLIHDARDRQIDHIDAAANDDSEAAKQKQRKLSDWYYIKTSPKAKPTSPYERRRQKNYNNYTTSNYAARYVLSICCGFITLCYFNENLKIILNSRVK